MTQSPAQGRGRRDKPVRVGVAVVVLSARPHTRRGRQAPKTGWWWVHSHGSTKNSGCGHMIVVPSLPNEHNHRHGGITNNIMPSIARPSGGFPPGFQSICNSFLNSLPCLVSLECTLWEGFFWRMPKQAYTVPCRALHLRGQGAQVSCT